MTVAFIVLAAILGLTLVQNAAQRRRIRRLEAKYQCLMEQWMDVFNRWDTASRAWKSRDATSVN